LEQRIKKARSRAKEIVNSPPQFSHYFWRAFLYGILGFVLLFTLISVGAFGRMPSFDDLENPSSALATQIISADGQVMGKYYRQNRSYVKYDEISPYVINALIATEDARFEQHSGIDGKAIARAVLLLGRRGGGSTITQQLALNLFAERSNNFIVRVFQKLKEWVIAIKLERRYTKQEIVAMYLNTVGFGRNTFGIQSASRAYFNTTPAKLNLQQASMLVGLLKGNTVYSPIRNPERALNRRNTVINNMVAMSFVTQPVADSVKKTPLKLELKSETHIDGIATHFRENLRLELEKWAETHHKPDGTKYDIYKDGLRVYTTLDSRMQAHAEAAVAEHMKRLQGQFLKHWKGKEPWGANKEIIFKGLRDTDWYKHLKAEGKSQAEITKFFTEKRKIKGLFTYNRGKIDTFMSITDSVKYAKMYLQIGFMSMEPSSGEVRAWVGGTNLAFNQFDHVNSKAKRQVGSTFKPIVYAVAINNGISPCQYIPNLPVTFPNYGNWTPKNFDGRYGGGYNMYTGLAKSVNTIAAYLMKQVGPQAVVEQSMRMGITTKIPAYPSICLGSIDISLYEMVGAYSTFANKGIWIEPIYLKRIEDKYGNVIEDFTPQTREAMSEENAYIMVQLMKGVIKRGTGSPIKSIANGAIDAPLAGKTGTTNDNSDGWFICYSPELTTGCWVGGEERAIAFRDKFSGTGGHMALPAVGLYLNKVYADKTLGMKKKEFDPPEHAPKGLGCGGGGGGSSSEGGGEAPENAGELF
jgi:penicillin-binding protein 1A